MGRQRLRRDNPPTQEQNRRYSRNPKRGRQRLRRDNPPKQEEERNYSRNPSRGRQLLRRDNPPNQGIDDSRNPSRGRKLLRRNTSPKQGKTGAIPRRRRHNDNSLPNSCLGVFGLNTCTTAEQLYQVFSRYGDVLYTEVALHRFTKISRGFGFICFASILDAVVAKKLTVGKEIGGIVPRLDYYRPKRAYTPTPGSYMGHYRRRSQSPYYRNNGAGYRSRSSSPHHSDIGSRYTRRSPSAYRRVSGRRY